MGRSVKDVLFFAGEEGEGEEGEGEGVMVTSGWPSLKRTHLVRGVCSAVVRNAGELRSQLSLLPKQDSRAGRGVRSGAFCLSSCWMSFGLDDTRTY